MKIILRDTYHLRRKFKADNNLFINKLLANVRNKIVDQINNSIDTQPNVSEIQDNDDNVSVRITHVTDHAMPSHIISKNIKHYRMIGRQLKSDDIVRKLVK